MNFPELDRRDHLKISEEKISVDTRNFREGINQKKLKITKVLPLVQWVIEKHFIMISQGIHI